MIATLPSPQDKGRAEYNLMHLFHCDIVASDVFFSSWFDNEFIDSHGVCITSPLFPLL